LQTRVNKISVNSNEEERPLYFLDDKVSG
jgi:hypothetical protein